MAKASGLGDNFFIAGYDLSGDVGAVTVIAARRALLDVTAIDQSAFNRIVGQRDGEISFNTWFNDATDQEHDALKGLLTTDRVAMYFRGTTVGNEAACMIGKQINYDWDRSPDGSLAGTIQALANGFGLEWCKMLTAGKDTDTTPTNGSSIDYGSVSSLFGLAAYLNVFSFTGTSVTVKLQDSADDTSFADIAGAAFTAATGRTEERIETGLTATVRRYVRRATTGTFTNAVFACAFIRYLTARDP